MVWGFGTKKALRLIVSILLGLFIIWTFRSSDGRSGALDQVFASARSAIRQGFSLDFTSRQHRLPGITVPSYCHKLKLDNIAFVTKTGATEAKDKLPSQLATCLSCISDPLIFSDLDQTLGAYQIHDVLSGMSPEVWTNNHDFDIYFKQKKLASQGREDEIEALAQLPIRRKDWRTKDKSAAWALDKYKFLQMIDRAWEYQPEKDWYVFIEADTYLSLPNLVNSLTTQDPTQKLYFGNAVRMWEHPIGLFFAHGGSGFILSGATVRDFASTHKGLAASIAPNIRYEQFGDFLVADVLDRELHVRVTDISPMMQGDSPTNFPFAEDNWCRPVISMHYMTPADFERVFEYERSHDLSPMSMLYRDLHAITFDTAFPLSRDDWDNGSDDGRYTIDVASDVPWLDHGIDEKTMDGRNGSFDACERACTLHAGCLQFSFHVRTNKTECHLSRAFRLGQTFKADVDLEPDKSVSSGWLNEKITKWVSGHQSCPG